MERAVNAQQTTGQRIADHLEQVNVGRYAAVRVVGLGCSIEAIVVEAIRAVESRMRLELALARLSRSGVAG
jgi:hypothetical protein